VVTLTSVGFGDLTPETWGGKVFTIFYALLGISIVTLAISQVRRRGPGEEGRREGEEEEGGGREDVIIISYCHLDWRVGRRRRRRGSEGK